MSEFLNRGSNEIGWFFDNDRLKEDFDEYVSFFENEYGKEITVRDYVEYRKAQAIVLLAKAVFDFPENLFDDKGMFENHFNFSNSAIKSIGWIAESISEIAEAIKENKK